MLMTTPSMNVGIQPIDQVMIKLGLNNHALVATAGDGLTHKMVQRARKGRRLTRRTQDKVMRALNSASPERRYEREELFTYIGA